MNRRDSLSAPLKGNISTDILYSGDADSELADTLSPKMALRRKDKSGSKIEEELVRQAKRLEAIQKSTAKLVSQITSNARDLLRQGEGDLDGEDEVMGSNNDTNRDSPEKMLRYAEAELTDLLRSQRELTKQRAIHLVKVYAALDRIEKHLENRRREKLIRCFGCWYDVTREKTSSCDDLPDSTPVREYTSLLRNFKTPRQLSFRKMPETIRKQKREIDQLNAKLQLYRDAFSKGNEEEKMQQQQQQQRSKNQLDNEDHTCPLCSQVKYCVTNDRMMMMSGPIVEKVVECMPSPQGYMAAALLRAVFLHYVGNDDENMMSQIQFIVFATDCELVNKQNQSPTKTDFCSSRSCIEVSELWRIVFDTYRSSSTTVTQSSTVEDAEMPAEWYVRCQNHSLLIQSTSLSYY